MSSSRRAVAGSSSRQAGSVESTVSSDGWTLKKTVTADEVAECCLKVSRAEGNKLFGGQLTMNQEAMLGGGGGLRIDMFHLDQSTSSNSRCSGGVQPEQPWVGWWAGWRGWQPAERRGPPAWVAAYSSRLDDGWQPAGHG
ncbi:hypothetical protein FH972_014688 [Carpinus fangiana]|uniref:Uncharacterized protein n=1 Tax=Carpinus fangiana TaxID=176857 RepID=A0A5N6RAR0_9ROSI|nr:hypothetical protein FH972_014688 [Carpinus fangiana]